MSDPISAGLQIFCSAIEAASSIAEYSAKHRVRKEQRAAAAQKARPEVKNTATSAPSWQKENLPHGWEMRMTKAKKVYFVNHNTKATTFNDPRDPSGENLPTEWERKMTEDNRVYFVNHITKTTTWNDPRDPEHRAQSGKPDITGQAAQATKIDQVNATSSSEELFLVLGTLGQRLIAIAVIEDSNIPTAYSVLRKSIPIFSKELSVEFDDLDTVLQYAVTCAIFFCAACYPVHIYRGFGCGVLDDMTWGVHPLDTSMAGFAVNEKLTIMDKVLAYLKSVPHDLKLLKKSPDGVDKVLPQYNGNSEEDEELSLRIWEEVVRSLDRCGFPKPKDKRIIVKTWRAPIAHRNGSAMYSDNHRFCRAHSTYQMDAGRFLFAWLVWKRLDLRAGELLWLTEQHITALAEWLEGLDGMTFKLLRDDELDWSHISYAPWLAEMLLKMCGNELGIDGTPSFVVREPKYNTEPLDLAIEAPQSEDALGSLSTSKPIQNLAHRRLPPPLPEPTNRLAKAKFSFQSTDAEELSFVAADMLEILDDKRDDGWWKARLNKKVGLVPASYLS